METTHIQSQKNYPKVSEEQQGSSSSFSSNTHSHPYPYSNPQHDSDEINLLEYIYVLVKNKWWIIGAAVLGLVMGYVAAKIKGPSYVSEAVVAAKESSNSNASNISGLGMLGGMVASQLNISQNPGLDKIELILDSKKFSAELIDKYKLLPEIYKHSWPKQYKKWFDTTRADWRDGFHTPNMLSVGAYLKNKYLKIESKNGLMTISIKSKDAAFTDTLMSRYLEYLNFYVKRNVQSDAKENVTYLDSQLITATDPLLREKLQNMIAVEMEKAMLVSQHAFKLIDPPLEDLQFKEKKLYPIVFSLGLAFFAILIIILTHVFTSESKSEEDKKLIQEIKHELFGIKVK